LAGVAKKRKKFHVMFRREIPKKARRKCPSTEGWSKAKPKATKKKGKMQIPQRADSKGRVE